MGNVILGIDKNRPHLIVFIDDVSRSASSMAWHESINPKKFFVGASDSDGKLDGRMYDIDDLEQEDERTATLTALFDKFAAVPCPLCGQKLVREGDMFVCENPESPPTATYRKNEPCPFRAPLDYFLDKAQTHKEETDAA